MDTTAADAVAPPEWPASRGAFTESLHVLVDRKTREYVMGVAANEAARRGYKFLRQGEVIRDLLSATIVRTFNEDPEAYAEVVRRGRQVLAESADTGAAGRPA